MRYRSTSPDHTRRIAVLVAALVKKFPPHRHAAVIALRGDLGSGKTTFTQAFLRAFGVRGHIPSPTFILMQRYPLRHRRFKAAYHIDGYRLRTRKDFRNIGLHELVADPSALLLIEWPARARSFFPAAITSVSFAHGRTEHERSLTVRIPRKP